LVAEDRNGYLWAIQAKADDAAYRVTKRDVNKFFAESGRKIFSYRLLIATTNLIGRTGERTIQDQEKLVRFLRLSDLEAAEVQWPPPRRIYVPHRYRNRSGPKPYQRQAISRVTKGFGG